MQRFSRGFLFSLLAQYLDGGIFPGFTMVRKFVEIPQCCREIRAVRVSRGATLVFYLVRLVVIPDTETHTPHTFLSQFTVFGQSALPT